MDVLLLPMSLRFDSFLVGLCTSLGMNCPFSALDSPVGERYFRSSLGEVLGILGERGGRGDLGVTEVPAKLAFIGFILFYGNT